MAELIIAATGHRPDKLGGYSQRVTDRLYALARAYLLKEREKYPGAEIKIIAGGALGWDTAIELAALDLGLYLTIAIPFDGQELKWKADQQALYRDIISRANEAIVLYPGKYAAYKMTSRNCWMVDRAHKVAALWNGQDNAHSGTAQCVAYAQEKSITVVNLWRSWVRHAGVTKPPPEHQQCACGNKATIWCDGKQGEDKTCDRPMCRACVPYSRPYIACLRGKGRRSVTGSIDYCRDCAIKLGYLKL